MDRRFLKIFPYLFLLFSSIYISSCSHLPKLNINKQHFLPPCRIAILPFFNESKDPAANRLLYRVLLSYIVDKNICEVVPEGMVRRFFITERFLPGEPVSLEKLHLLAQRTGAQAVITGKVLEVEDKPCQHIKLGFYFRVQDTSSGKILWTTYHKRTGEDYRKILHFGRICSLTHLAQKMVEEVVEQWKDKGLIGCR